MKRLTLKIYGRVQGIFFRTSTRAKAQELSLVGWVRNAPDGTVEIVAEGEESKLLELKKFCEEGPELASVSKVEEKWEEIGELSFDSFKINY